MPSLPAGSSPALPSTPETQASGNGRSRRDTDPGTPYRGYNVRCGLSYASQILLVKGSSGVKVPRRAVFACCQLIGKIRREIVVALTNRHGGQSGIRTRCRLLCCSRASESTFRPCATPSALPAGPPCYCQGSPESNRASVGGRFRWPTLLPEGE